MQAVELDFSAEEIQPPSTCILLNGWDGVRVIHPPLRLVGVVLFHILCASGHVPLRSNAAQHK